MRFFFYGTLMAGSGNPLARLVEEKLHPLGPARARGVLYGIPDPLGWYPALLPGEGQVQGRLYGAGARFTADDLARLDRYEDSDAARPGASLYLRRPVIVTVTDGAPAPAGPADAYIFNQPLPAGSRAIPQGDFRAWLAEHGLEQFRGRREGEGPGEPPRDDA